MVLKATSTDLLPVRILKRTFGLLVGLSANAYLGVKRLFVREQTPSEQRQDAKAKQKEIRRKLRGLDPK